MVITLNEFTEWIYCYHIISFKDLYVYASGDAA